MFRRSSGAGGRGQRALCVGFKVTALIALMKRCGGDNQRELTVELSGQPRQEGRRQKHRHEHERDADDRPGQSSIALLAASRPGTPCST